MTRLRGLLALLTVFSLIGTPGFASEEEEKASSYYHFSLARLHHLNRDYRAALEELEKALKIDPDSGRLHFEYARSLQQAGEIQRAVEECEKSIELDPDQADPHFLLGQIYRSFAESRQPGMVDKSVDSYRRAVELEPGHAEALYYLGYLSLLRGDHEQADSAFARFNQIRPSYTKAFLYRAQALVGLGRTEDAIEVLKSSLNSGDENPENLTFLARLYQQVQRYDEALDLVQRAEEVAPTLELRFDKGVILARQGQFDEAIPLFRELLEKAPNHPGLRIELGKALEGARRFTEAVEVFADLLEEKPDDTEANYYMASSLRALGRRQEAIERMKHLLEVTDGEDQGFAHYRTRFKSFLGVLYQEDRQYKAAVQLFRDISKENPEDSRVKLGLVFALRDVGEFKEALALSSSLLEERPSDLDFSDILITHARVLAQDGRLDEAIDVIVEQIKIEPIEDLYLAAAQLYNEHKEFEKAEQMVARGLEFAPQSELMKFQLASLHERQGRYSEAEAGFLAILESNPRQSAVLNYLGYMLAERGERLKEALDYVQRALKIEPDNGAFLDSLGWVYFKLDKLELAEAKLTQAARINDSDPTILEHLGDLYHRLGDYPKAEEYYERSVSFAEDQEEREKVESKLFSIRQLLSRQR